MAKQVALEAQIRDELGKEKAKKLRLKGLVPAEFYGKGATNLHLLVEHRSFEKAIASSEARYNSIFNLNIKDAAGKEQKEIVLLREYQRNAMTDKFEHFDFLRIDTKAPIFVKVKVKLIGESQAVKDGLMLAQAMHDLPIKCLPLEIPLYIEVDISVLKKAHDAIRVSDLTVPNATIELPAGQEIIHAEVPRELKVEAEVAEVVSADVPTSVQSKPEDGAAAGDAKKPAADGKKPEAAKADAGKKPEAPKK